ncbi:MAG TPA: long-chain fatty acid--CoA ligase [Chitinophagales bacterium]|nr:long-chain fatty acid--CoA ligase [Chitinophagales bacterium]HNM31813.1 long-chain fatty acid--CoA ligase [Chitinophagales bacterium]
MDATRLFDLLEIQNKNVPNDPFLSSKVNGTWVTYTFKEVQQYANRASQLLLNIGLKKGDAIALISANRPEWNFIDFGAMQIGVTVVPMYPTIAERDYEYIFNDAAICYAFIDNEVVYNKVKPLLQKISSFKGIYSFDKLPNVPSLIASLPATVQLSEIDKRKKATTEEDIATIIYTSGTTGNPKGVMLTHKNILSDIYAVKKVINFGNGEKSLSFLPLCHSFERMVFYAYLAFRIHIHYAENLEKIGENLVEVKPYCFTTVPRMLEKVYDKIIAKGNALTGIKKQLFFWAMEVGSKYEIGKSKSPFYLLQLAIARKLVFTKWQEALGGNVQFIITGAAAMQPRLITLFTAAGIDIIEGYGLTETSPVLACNRVNEKERCIGTVGIPLPGIDIKFAEDGEILAKGDNIMKGYYNQPELTAEVIDKEGWFHTGDIGEWKMQNGYKFLKITDRKKELFKTAGGKYVAPQVLENKMKESPYIEQIMVVGGDDKKFVSALIIPAFSQLEEWATANHINYKTKTELTTNKEVIKLIHQEVKKYNTNFGHWEQIKKFVLLPEEWTVESGELTPTMKPKRKIVNERYKMEIESMYKGEHE